MIGNAAVRAFDVKHAAQLSQPVQARLTQAYAQTWKSIGVEQKRWRKE